MDKVVKKHGEKFLESDLIAYNDTAEKKYNQGIIRKKYGNPIYPERIIPVLR